MMIIDKKTINLWNGNPPSKSGLSGSEIINPEELLEATNVTEAQLIIYSPGQKLNTGTATIIGPGGAYAGLAITTQGYDFAEWLASVGITGIVLKTECQMEIKKSLWMMFRKLSGIYAAMLQRWE